MTQSSFWLSVSVMKNQNYLVFILVHLFLYDYGKVKRPIVFDNITQSFAKSPVSLNAIFFATILLSSRLEKVRQVYVLLLLSMMLFGFFPVFRQSLRGYSRNLADALAFGTSLLNFYLIWNFSHMYAGLYLVVVLFVTMISPILFIYAYQFKNDI